MIYLPHPQVPVPETALHVGEPQFFSAVQELLQDAPQPVEVFSTGSEFIALTTAIPAKTRRAIISVALIHVFIFPPFI